MKIGVHTAAAAVFLVVLAGCGPKYHTVIDTSLQGKRVAQAKILVLPVTGVSYEPPTACIDLSPGGTASQYENMWNADLHKKLPPAYPQQTWIFFDPAADTVLASLGLTMGMVNALAVENVVSQKKTTGPERPVAEYRDLAVNDKMANILAKLTSAYGADFVVFFLQPRLSGEITTTYSAPVYGAGGMMTGGGTSSQKSYTADMRVQMWEARSGKLVMCSGTIYEASEFCMFMPAQDASIRRSVDELLKVVNDVVAYMLERSGLRLARR